MKYRAEIDGLRALAIVPVILFHAGFSLFSGGFVGVDVFFVISGYLITTILIEDIENKRFSIVNFYERRARRILPALFVVMLACIPFAWMWMLPSQMKDFAQSLVAVSLFASNILFWRESGYFAAASEEKPLLHTWSLAVEEQYYVLFPVFLFLAWRFGKNKVFWMIVVMAALSLLASEWGWRNKATANFYLAPTRAWELFAGSIAAFIVQKRGVQKNNPLALVGLTAIIFSIFFYDESTPFPSVYALVPVLGVVLLVLFAEKETFTARFLSNKLFVGIGLVSYSAYLWHQPLLAFAKIKTSHQIESYVVYVILLATTLVAFISWKFIEQPFRNRNLFSRKMVLSISIIGICTFILLGFISITNQNFDHLRFPNKPPFSSIYSTKDSDIASKVRSDRNSSCDKLDLEVVSEEVCVTNSEKPELLIVGDSKAMAFASAIFGGYFDIPTLLISGHSCPIYPELKYKPTYKVSWDNNCTAISDKIAFIKESIPSLKSAIIVNHAVKANDEISRYSLNDRKLTNNEAMLLGFGKLFTALNAANLSVTFVTDVPKLKNNAIACIYRDDLQSNHCNVTRTEVTNERTQYYKNINLLKERNHFSLYDSLDFLCQKNDCISYSDDKLLYFDQTHLTPYGASLLINSMISKHVLDYRQ